MAGELVPELHDIGKLVDNDALAKEIPAFKGASHWFKDINLDELGLPRPDTLSWQGVMYHHRLKPSTQFGSLPNELKHILFETIAAVAVLKLSDDFAASTSRALREKLEEEELGINQSKWSGFNTKTVQVLWRPEQTTSTVNLVGNLKELGKLLTFLKSDPDKASFFSNYGEVLAKTPEEKGFPRNITCLKTHVDLVGRCYKVFQPYVNADSQKKVFRYQGVEARSVEEAEARWPFRLARCKIIFPQRPTRAHDLGIFLKLQELMRQVEENDHVLLHTLDTLLLFLPVQDILPLRDSPLKPFLDAGFTVEADVAERPLSELDSNIFTKHKECLQPFYLQPEMPAELPPHLCDLCQRRPAQEAPDEKSGIIEHLCQTCLGFRDLSKNRGSFTKLGGKWEDEDIPVAWVRVRLDYNHLPEVLGDLYQRYMVEPLPGQKSGISTGEIETLGKELRTTALMVDFTEDYNNKLLVKFYASLSLNENMGNENIEGIMEGDRPELLAVALKEAGQALEIGDIFIEEFGKLFPLCENNSPISLSMSISNAKYPFFEHWDYLDKPKKEAINIQTVGHAPLELAIPRFRKLRELNLEKASSKLHHAAAVGARTGSQLMQKIDFLDGLGKCSGLHHAHIGEGFSVEQLLSYQKIMGIGGQP